MKKHLLKILFAVLAFITIFFLVKLKKQSKDAYNLSIHPPISSNNIPFEEYKFDANKGILIERPSGTVIKIPPNAFVDLSGNKVNNKVVLKVREFHQANDIFLSGIPMTVDSTRKEFLESVGMIELRAFSNESSIDLAQGIQAEISLASFRNSVGYNLYYLDKDKSWIATDSFRTTKNILKSNALDSMQLVLKKAERRDIIFEIVANLDQVPQLKAFEGLKWKISKKDVDDKLMEAMRVQWDNVIVKPILFSNKKFKLVFKKQMDLRGEFVKRVEKTFQINAIPLKNGSEITKNEMAFLYQNYDSVKFLVDQETFRLSIQADLINSFKIKKLGIWNCDRLRFFSDLVYKEVDFNFKNKINPKLNNLSLYVINLDDNSVIEYLYKDWNRVGFMTGKKMQVNLVIPGGKLIEVDDKTVSTALSKGDSKFVFDTKY